MSTLKIKTFRGIGISVEHMVNNFLARIGSDNVRDIQFSHDAADGKINVLVVYVADEGTPAGGMTS